MSDEEKREAMVAVLKLAENGQMEEAEAALGDLPDDAREALEEILLGHLPSASPDRSAWELTSQQAKDQLQLSRDRWEEIVFEAVEANLKVPAHVLEDYLLGAG